MHKLFILLTLAMLVGCSPASATTIVDVIRETTTSIMENSFENDAQYIELYITLDTLVVFCIDESHFKGVAATVFEGNSYSVPVVMELDQFGTLWAEWDITSIQAVDSKEELTTLFDPIKREQQLIVRKYNALAYRAWKVNDLPRMLSLKQEIRTAVDTFCKEHPEYCGE